MLTDCAEASHHVEIPSHVSHPMCSTPLIYLSVYVIWYLTSHPAISVPCRKGTGSFCCLVRRGCVGQMPCVGFWEWPNGYWEPLCTPEADLALFLLLCVSKASFHPFLDCVVFSLETPIPIFSWEKCSYFYSQWQTAGAISSKLTKRFIDRICIILNFTVFNLMIKTKN